MIVEAKRNIPWTKPDDISFDPEKPPELWRIREGTFLAALAEAPPGCSTRKRPRTSSSG